MRLYSVLAALSALLSLHAVYAALELTYASDVFSISFLSSDIFGNSGNHLGGPDHYVWQITGLDGKVHFPSVWGACDDDSIALQPCFRGSVLVVPVSAAQLAAGTPVSLPLPSATDASNVLVTAALRSPPTLSPLRVAHARLDFSGGLLPVSASSGVLFNASFVPTTILDDQTSEGELFLFFEPKLPAEAAPVTHVTVLFPSDLWIIPDPPRRVGFSVIPSTRGYGTIRPEQRLRMTSSERAISVPLDPVSVSSRTRFILVVSNVRSSRTVPTVPVLRAFASGAGRTFALPFTHLQYIPSSDGVFQEDGVSLITLQTNERTRWHFEDAAHLVGLYGKYKILIGGEFPGAAAAAYVIEIPGTAVMARAMVETSWPLTIAQTVLKKFHELDTWSAELGTVIPWAPAGKWLCPAPVSSPTSFVPCPQDGCDNSALARCVVNDSVVATMYCSFAKEPKDGTDCASNVAPAPAVLLV